MSAHGQKDPYAMVRGLSYFAVLSKRLKMLRTRRMGAKMTCYYRKVVANRTMSLRRILAQVECVYLRVDVRSGKRALAI